MWAGVRDVVLMNGMRVAHKRHVASAWSVKPRTGGLERAVWELAATVKMPRQHCGQAPGEEPRLPVPTAT